MTETAFDGSILWGLAGLVFALAMLVVVVAGTLAAVYAYFQGWVGFSWLASAWSYVSKFLSSKKE